MVPPRCLQRDAFRTGQERLQGLRAVDLEGEAVGPNHHPPDAGVEIGRRGRWRQARPVRGEPRGVWVIRVAEAAASRGSPSRSAVTAAAVPSHARSRATTRPVKEFEAGHSRDPSSTRLLFACRRARRVRSRLPPPPPSPADDRTPGSLGRNPEFFLWMPGDFDGRGRGAEKTRHVWSEVAAGVRMIVSRAGFRGPGGAHVRASRDTPPTDGGSGLGTAQCCRPPRQSLRPRESHPGVIPGYPGLKLL